MTETTVSIGQAVCSLAKQIKDRWKRWKYVSNPRRFWERRGAKDNFQQYPADMLNEQSAFFLDQLSDIEFRSALEVGCGHGRMLKFTCAPPKVSSLIVGLDFARPQLKKAQLSLGGQCDLVQATALSLPFRDGAFDLVYSVDVLMHIPPDYVRNALLETIRVSAKYVLFAEGIYKHFNMFGLDFRAEYEALGLKTIRCVTNPYRVLRPKPIQFVVMEKVRSTAHDRNRQDFFDEGL